MRVTGGATTVDSTALTLVTVRYTTGVVAVLVYKSVMRGTISVSVAKVTVKIGTVTDETTRSVNWTVLYSSGVDSTAGPY